MPDRATLGGAATDGDAERAAQARETVGLRLREAHYPGRAPIDAYGDGGFRFAGMSHRGALLCLPSGIYGWNVGTFDALTPADFAKVAGEGDLELLIVGAGTELRPVPRTIREALADHGVRTEPMSTGAAVRTLNVLLAEDRPVGAALLPVD